MNKLELMYVFSFYDKFQILNAVTKKQLKAKIEKPAKKEKTSVLTEEDMKLILENYEGL